jgi:hypothetical protein
MSDTDQNENISSENLIDLESSVSVPSSGELYEPSDEFDSDDSRYNNLSQAGYILDRANNSIGNTDSVSRTRRTYLN